MNRMLTSAFGMFDSLAGAVGVNGENVRSRIAEGAQKRLDNIRNTPEPETSAGLFTMVGLSLLLAAIAYFYGGFAVVGSDLHEFLTGHVFDLTKGTDLLPTSLAVICGMLAASMASAVLVGKLLGKASGEHAIAKEMAKMAPGNQLGNLLFVVFLEEVLARGLFLGLLTRIPGLHGPVAFYWLFLLGNLGWAALHLFNFTDPKDRHILRVLPQFIGGVFLTYIFVKFGFLMAVVVHLGFDALVFSVHKRESITRRDVEITIYSAVLALVSYMLVSKPFTDLQPWFSNTNSSFVIPGWGFWDYLKMHLCITSALSAMCGLLLFDRPLTTKKAVEIENSKYMLLTPLVSFLGVGIIFGSYWFAGLFVRNVDIRVLVLGVVFACARRGRSGSSTGRAFWQTVPSVFLSICVLEALGFWYGSLIVITEWVLGLPLVLLENVTHADETLIEEVLAPKEEKPADEQVKDGDSGNSGNSEPVTN